MERKGINMIRLGVVFGGQSSEYSVSLHSAASFLREIHRDQYEMTMIGISQEGQFYLYEGSIDDLEHDHWQANAKPISFCHRGILCDQKKIEIDVMFPILHGKNGEDGAFQGLCQMMNIRCVGSDVLGSALCMDKELMHILCDQANIPCADYVCFYEHEGIQEVPFDLPWVVKPCNAGSSYGVSFVRSKDELEQACQLAWQYDGRGKLLVEKAIKGFEIGCAVMGNQKLTTGRCDEIEIQTGVFDFEGKYEMKNAAIYCPARIDEQTEAKAISLAKRVYRTMQAQDLARVDMFVCEDGQVVLNEINTIPGFTNTSRYPSMMAAKGLSFADLIDQLVELAAAREVGVC